MCWEKYNTYADSINTNTYIASHENVILPHQAILGKERVTKH